MTIKIASFNINGIKARLPRLLEWLEETRPTVVALQDQYVAIDLVVEVAIEVQAVPAAVFANDRARRAAAAKASRATVPGAYSRT